MSFYKDLPPTLPKEKQATASIDELVEGNLKLVVFIANQFSSDINVVEDLMQEGAIGLYKAAQRFDPNRGASFGTYASFWIKQKIRRYLQDTKSLIRIPNHQFDKKGIGRKYKEQVTNALTGVFSINDITFRDGEEEIEIKDEDADDPHVEASVLEFNLLLSSIMKSTLDEREQVIIKERFNLENKYDKVPTLDELGERFHLTRERIRQIEFKALRKLRSKLELESNQ